MPAAAHIDRRSDYVSAVAVELGDLAPDDRAELIEELDDHIAALLEDRPEVDLTAELGTPRSYAAELRTAAGLAGGAAAKTPLPHRMHDAVVRLNRRVPDGLRPWLAGLRPTWWVMRGYLIVAGFCYWWHQTWANSGIGVLFPAPAGNWVIGLLLVVVGAAASVRIATWPGLAPRTSRLIAAGIGVLAVVSLGGMWSTARYANPSSGGFIQTEYVQNCPIELDNLYAYDSTGKPLQNVRLFDQNGNPFDLSVFQCNASGQYAPDGFVNQYPWPTASYGDNAEPTGPPTSLAPLPGATVSPTSGATPTTNPTAPTPTGSPTP